MITFKATNVGLIWPLLIVKKYMKSIGVGLNVFLHFLSMLSVMCLCGGTSITEAT